MSTQYSQLIELGKDKKMIAAAEVGAAPLPSLLQAYNTHWLWFAVWGDTFINNPDWNSLDTLKQVSRRCAPLNYSRRCSAANTGAIGVHKRLRAHAR